MHVQSVQKYCFSLSNMQIQFVGFLLPSSSYCLLKLPKELRRLLQRKRHIKMELCVGLCGLGLCYVGNVLQNRRGTLSLAWHEWFSCKGKERKIYCCELPLSSEPQKLKFHVVIWQTTSKIAPKSVAHVQHDYFSLMQPIKSFICGVVVDVAVVISKTPYSL